METKFLKNKVGGFTLIELLIVISIIGIFSGIIFNTINVGKQRARATDALKRSTVDKLSEAIASYRMAEGLYPPCTVAGGCNTLTDMGTLSDYVDSWPDPEYYYIRDDTSAVPGFCVYVVLSINSARYYKFSTTTGAISVVGSTTCP